MIRFPFNSFKYWPQLASLAILLLGFLAYRYFAYYDTRSNDAYVSANIVNMKAIVSGPISQRYVVENQRVKKGQKLIEIDPLPYQYAVDEAKARLKIAEIAFQNSQHEVIEAQQKLKRAQVMLGLSQDHYKRFSALQKKGDEAKIVLINLTDKMKEQEAAIEEATQALTIAETNVDDSNVLAAKAALNQAEYLLNHTMIIAPEDGFITNFNLRVGQYINAGEGLFALVDTKKWWVLTRYRETAIRLIKPGDKAKITIDMYPGTVFHGHVGSIGWGINRVQQGNVATSTLAYLEPTEDWIRIAQRFPVRIYIDDVSDEYPLRIGASATTVTYR